MGKTSAARKGCFKGIGGPKKRDMIMLRRGARKGTRKKKLPFGGVELVQQRTGGHSLFREEKRRRGGRYKRIGLVDRGNCGEGKHTAIALPL